MKYFKGTYNECQNLAIMMDDFFGYPNIETKTTTTSEIEFIPNTVECCIFIPAEYIEQMRSEEVERLLDENPIKYVE